MKKRPLLQQLLFSAVLSVTASTLSAATIDLSRPAEGQVSGLVAYYPFNETSGTLAADLTGDYNGQVQPGVGTAPSWSTQGKFGGALSFNNPTFSSAGPQGHVKVAPSTGDLNLVNTDFTIGFWLKLNSLPTEPTAQTVWLLDKKNGSNGAEGWGVSLESNVGGNWSIYVRGAGSAVTFIGSRVGLFNDMDWHHVGIVFDNDAKELAITLDGESISLSNGVTAFTGVPNSTSFDLSIGQRTGAGGSNVDFSMDDLFISDQMHSFAIPESSTTALLVGGAALVVCGISRRMKKGQRSRG